MTGFLFPGQGAQFPGIGKSLYESSELAASLFEKGNEVLGYRITDTMFEGSEDDLKQTKITQPAVFLHSMVSALAKSEVFQPMAVAGHSLGEFSALVAAKAIGFEQGLKLVQLRAEAMQKACEAAEGTMAAVIGLDDEVVEKICDGIDEVVVPANYNCPGQLVISGSVAGIEKAVEQCSAAGALKAIVLKVGGAFHSPLMEPARKELQEAIEQTLFEKPICPIYQNVSARAETEPDRIRQNLIEQLTAPVRWTQTMRNMIDGGIEKFVEVGGNGKVLRGFVRRVDRKFPTEAL